MFRSYRIAFSLALALSLTAAAPGVKVQVIGGTLSALPAKTVVHLDLTGAESLSLQSGPSHLAIPYQRINTLEYGQNVSRRYAEAILISPVFLLAKSHKHFVTLGYVDPEGKQQAIVFRVDKGDIRSVLTSLEARTGRRVEFQDQEARKAGKG
ncbi:MAG TPA: hypothetical protein VMH28_01750 [Candidatus Acidoferrales bacterium]|nr:hypothetical protein [Candidatus Acidoferrales bacterium]